jgi:ferredoxin-nitrate reductase
MIKIGSRRGNVKAVARITDIISGTVFIPFHYGYWDADENDHERSANELTIPVWDPISKQPHFKYAAVNLEKINEQRTLIGDMVETVKDKLNL